MTNEKLLFVDGCISTHPSRTKKLAINYIEHFMAVHGEVGLETVVLRKGKIEPMSRETLKNRDISVADKDFEGDEFHFATQFKEADYIVIAAPYWDLSFPAVLKIYIENIAVADLTFKVTDEGFVGLCKGKKLVYITTAGGYIGNQNFGYDYVAGVGKMLGIKTNQFICAEGLDIEGNDPEAILEKVINEIQGM